MCSTGQDPAAGRHTSPLASKVWACALSHVSSDKHACPKGGQKNSIPGPLETKPPATPFCTKPNLILSLEQLAGTPLHREDCSAAEEGDGLLEGHTQCESGYLIPLSLSFPICQTVTVSQAAQ